MYAGWHGPEIFDLAVLFISIWYKYWTHEEFLFSVIRSYVGPFGWIWIEFLHLFIDKIVFSSTTGHWTIGIMTSYIVYIYGQTYPKISCRIRICNNEFHIETIIGENWEEKSKNKSSSSHIHIHNHLFEICRCKLKPSNYYFSNPYITFGPFLFLNFLSVPK